jgi:hypothetical protein
VLVLGPDEAELPAEVPLLGVGERVRVAREDVWGVRTEHAPAGRGATTYRLLVDVGLRRQAVLLEVGTPAAPLTEPEVDWLARVLTAWRDADYAPVTSRTSSRNRATTSSGESKDEST